MEPRARPLTRLRERGIRLFFFSFSLLPHFCFNSSLLFPSSFPFFFISLSLSLSRCPIFFFPFLHSLFLAFMLFAFFPGYCRPNFFPFFPSFPSFLPSPTPASVSFFPAFLYFFSLFLPLLPCFSLFASYFLSYFLSSLAYPSFLPFFSFIFN